MPLDACMHVSYAGLLVLSSQAGRASGGMHACVEAWVVMVVIGSD